MSHSTDFSESTMHILDPLPSESAPVGSDQEENPSRYRELESRLDVLESAILEHATLLRDRIGNRLDRLEDKLRYEATGLRRALENENADRDEKIIQLTESFTAAVDRVELKTEAGTVKATMEDLIAALASTRSHLDTLALAVSKTRSELSA